MRTTKARPRTLLPRTSVCILLFCAASFVNSAAQTFNVLTNFVGTNGANPYGTLVQGIDGNFYGTTYIGGGTDYGTIFNITPAGQLTTLYNFCQQEQCADGNEPETGLVLGANGLFYGITTGGGNSICGCGTVFSTTATGGFTSLYQFEEIGGVYTSRPEALVQATNGQFYGITASGVAFQMTPTRNMTLLSQFPAGGSFFTMMQSASGNFYATTLYGGEYGFGAIYQMTPSGDISTLFNFCQQNCTTGLYPQASPVQGLDGNLYGTTTEGGPSNAGTVFKITPTGELATLYNFCSKTNCADGSYPRWLVRGNDGNFYGVTYYGGRLATDDNILSGYGTIFKITPAGKLTTIYRFCSEAKCVDGANPFAGLVQGTDGSFYGTTLYGGTNTARCPQQTFTGPCGTVFNLNVGLSPFVKMAQQSGPVGKSGGILGQGLTGATRVSFNGTPASFTVVSDTYLQATVPLGATTGYVTVDTPSGALKSNVPFRVIQ